VMGSLGARRLIGFTDRGITQMCSSAMSWMGNATANVLGGVAKVLGVNKVVELFKNATEWVKKGVQVAKHAWDCMTKLEGKLLHIFNDFKPLKPIFANKTGLMSLITSQTNMATLIHVVEELLNTSSNLDELGGAMHSVSEMFQEMSSLFRGALGRVDENVTRRLSAVDDPRARVLSETMTGYMELMQNLDFKKLVPLLLGFMQNMQQHSNELTKVEDILRPLLLKIDAAVPPPAGRRMSDLSNVHLDEIMQNQQKYARAIKAIIPTWQAIEKTGIAMCPVVAESNGTSGSLKCRVAKFVEKAALPQWVGSMISGLVSGCPEPNTDSTGCPTTSHSADINDLLGQNAEYMGWVIAIGIAVLGVLGFGAVGAAKQMSQNGEEDDEEESDEEGELQPLR